MPDGLESPTPHRVGPRVAPLAAAVAIAAALTAGYLGPGRAYLDHHSSARGPLPAATAPANPGRATGPVDNPVGPVTAPPTGDQQIPNLAINYIGQTVTADIDGSHYIVTGGALPGTNDIGAIAVTQVFPEGTRHGEVYAASGHNGPITVISIDKAGNVGFVQGPANTRGSFNVKTLQFNAAVAEH